MFDNGTLPNGCGAIKNNNRSTLFNTSVNQLGFPELDWGRATWGLFEVRTVGRLVVKRQILGRGGTFKGTSR